MKNVLVWPQNFWIEKPTDLATLSAAFIKLRVGYHWVSAMKIEQQYFEKYMKL